MGDERRWEARDTPRSWCAVPINHFGLHFRAIWRDFCFQNTTKIADEFGGSFWVSFFMEKLLNMDTKLQPK